MGPHETARKKASRLEHAPLPPVTVSRGWAEETSYGMSSPRARLESNLVQASACELEGVRCPLEG